MSKNIVCGIYSIRNLINQKMYIGSSKNIHKRWKEHKKNLNVGKHTNSYLQKSWNKYKENNFIFSIICECSIYELEEIEANYIKTFNTCNRNFGYNLVLPKPDSNYILSQTNLSTHCINGHPYEGNNLIIDNGSRRCKICRNNTQLKRYYKKRILKRGEFCKRGHLLDGNRYFNKYGKSRGCKICYQEQYRRAYQKKKLISPRKNILSIEERRSKQGEFNRHKTHCIRGHEYNEQNTSIMKNGGRRCRVCDREIYRKKYLTKKKLLENK